MPKAPLALVTGGNRGIGAGVCRLLATQGYDVLLGARHEADGRRAARSMEGGPGGSVTPFVLDVTDEGSIAAARERLVAEGRPLAALVNNAAVSLDGFDADVVRRTLDVNFHGPRRLTDALLDLLPGPQSRIVMVSSGMGELTCVSRALRERFLDDELDREGVLGLAGEFTEAVERGDHRAAGWPSSAYSVSKALLNAWVRVLAHELGPLGPRVNAVCPGWVRTDMGGPSAPRDVEEGAHSVAWAATLDEHGPTGGFFRDGRAIPF